MIFAGISGLSLGGTAALLVWMGDVRWPWPLLHTAIEVGGSFAGLILAALLLTLLRYREDLWQLIWVVSGLAAMATIDIFHGCIGVGNTFVWLRVTAGLVGGILFACILSPARLTRSGFVSRLPVLACATAVTFASLSILCGPWLPTVIDRGQITTLGRAINFLGGVAFLISTVYFVRRFSRTCLLSDLLYGSLSILFGLGSILFVFSQLWSVDWWWSHLLRFLGYLTALWETFRLYREAHEEARNLRESLERQVEERTARLKSIFDSAVDGIFVIDERGIIESANPAAIRMFGYDAAELLGRNVSMLMPNPYRDAHDGYLSRYMKTGEKRIIGIGREVPGQRKDGSTFPISLSVSEVRLASMTRFVGITHDITKLKEAEVSIRAARDEAVRLTQLKSDFLANMSHEIRTPMNAIIGMTSLALDTDITPDQREYLTTVKASADHLLILINGILDLSKIEAGRLELEPADTDLRRLIDQIMKTTAVRAHAKRLEFAADVHSDVPRSIRTDPARLRQVLINLIGNAIKFTDAGDVILRVHPTPGPQAVGQTRLRFSVSDTGIGIPLDKQKAVFEAFSQADSSSARKFEGTGLGLTISRKLVELMGGDIQLESEPGRGSVFYFDVVFDITPGDAPKSAEGEAGLSGRRVLVIDDHKVNRDILVRMLGEWRMSAIAVASAQAAWEELGKAGDRSEPYDLIILDYMMPDLNGLELAEKIVAARRVPANRIVMISSSDQVDLIRRCREIGVRRLNKPVSQSDLLDTIVTVLSDTNPVPDQRYPVAAADVVSPSPARPFHILVAEDNPVNQRLVEKTLVKHRHTFVMAANGKEALDAFVKETFDLILMDAQMPEMDGYQATGAIRDAERSLGTRTPIIAMTARAMKGDRERCLEAGMDEYISKPFEPADMLNLIRRVMGASEGSAEGSRRDVSSGIVEAGIAKFGGSEELFREMAEVFLGVYSEQMGVLRRAVEAGDLTAMRRAAHTLKSSVSYFSPPDDPAPKLALTLEMMDEGGMKNDARRLFSQFESEVARISKALSEYFQAHKKEGGGR